MANYEKMLRLRPEVRQFVRNRRWVHRGDVISYGPNIASEGFSTDPMGFRHSVFKGETMSVRDILTRDRYGLLLGPSSVYGFGLAGNENTLPSQLGERLGFPVANIGLPEGNSRNLHSLLIAAINRAPKRPTAVVHVSGGDFTSFCYTAIADAVFGPPNLKQMVMVMKERGGKRPPVERQIRPLLNFSAMWIRTIGQLCKVAKIPLVLADDTTFFEKATPNALEIETELGKPFSDGQKNQFDTHKRFVDDYHARRRQVAEQLGVPLAGPGKTNDLGFIDEFHYDLDGTTKLADDYARGFEGLL